MPQPVGIVPWRACRSHTPSAAHNLGYVPTPIFDMFCLPGVAPSIRRAVYCIVVDF